MIHAIGHCLAETCNGKDPCGCPCDLCQELRDDDARQARDEGRFDRLIWERHGQIDVCRACGFVREGTAGSTLKHLERCRAAVVYVDMLAEVRRLRRWVAGPPPVGAVAELAAELEDLREMAIQHDGYSVEEWLAFRSEGPWTNLREALADAARVLRRLGALEAARPSEQRSADRRGRDEPMKEEEDLEPPSTAFLAELLQRARRYGWDGDYYEVERFVRTLHREAGIELTDAEAAPLVDPAAWAAVLGFVKAHAAERPALSAIVEGTGFDKRAVLAELLGLAEEGRISLERGESDKARVHWIAPSAPDEPTDPPPSKPT